MITLEHYLVVAAVLFVLGLIGFLTRRNFITMFLSAELMLQGVILNFVAFSYFHGNINGHVFSLFIITVAACESGLALALFLVLYRKGKSLDSGDWQNIREPGIPETEDIEPLPENKYEEPMPTLPVAGRIPTLPVEEEYTRA